MDYYNYISGENSSSILNELCEYIVDKYSLERNYSFSYEKYGFEDEYDCITICIDHLKIFIFSDNNIGYYEGTKIGFDDIDVISFFKYYQRKKVINELL